jgi:hypothetical protein
MWCSSSFASLRCPLPTLAGLWFRGLRFTRFNTALSESRRIRKLGPLQIRPWQSGALGNAQRTVLSWISMVLNKALRTGYFDIAIREPVKNPSESMSAFLNAKFITQVLVLIRSRYTEACRGELRRGWQRHADNHRNDFRAIRKQSDFVRHMVKCFF